MDESPKSSPSRSPQKAREQASQSPKKRRIREPEQKMIEFDNKSQKKDQILRGNMGFCPIDMSLVNNCGLPSLWIPSHEYINGGSKLTYVDQKGR